MSISFRCDKCGANYEVKAEHAGKRTKCAKCGQSIVVPKSDGVRPESASSSQTASPVEPSRSLRVTCTCGKSYSAKPQLAGKRVKCAACGSDLAIPGAAASDEPEPDDEYRLEDQPEHATPDPADHNAGSTEDVSFVPTWVGAGERNRRKKAPVGPSDTKCPRCSEELPDAAVICVSCGYQVSTDESLPTVTAPDARKYCPSCLGDDIRKATPGERGEFLKSRPTDEPALTRVVLACNSCRQFWLRPTTPEEFASECRRAAFWYASLVVFLLGILTVMFRHLSGEFGESSDPPQFFMNNVVKIAFTLGIGLAAIRMAGNFFVNVAGLLRVRAVNGT